MRDIVILGFAVDQNMNPVFDGAFGDSEIWTVNDWWNFYPRLEHPTRVYQIHDDYDDLKKVGQRNIANWKCKYNESKALAITSRTFTGLDNSRNFDFERAFSFFPKRLFTSSIAFAVMDAIMEHVDSISFRGVAMKADGEYGYQRPAICELVDRCIVAGIKLDVRQIMEWRRPAAFVNWVDVREVDIVYGRKP